MYQGATGSQVVFYLARNIQNAACAAGVVVRWEEIIKEEMPAAAFTPGGKTDYSSNKMLSPSCFIRTYPGTYIIIILSVLIRSWMMRTKTGISGSSHWHLFLCMGDTTEIFRKTCTNVIITIPDAHLHSYVYDKADVIPARGMYQIPGTRYQVECT